MALPWPAGADMSTCRAIRSNRTRAIQRAGPNPVSSSVGLWLEDQLDIQKGAPDEAHDVELDIERATQVPEHLINHNSPYDYAAYERIEKGLWKLRRII